MLPMRRPWTLAYVAVVVTPVFHNANMTERMDPLSANELQEMIRFSVNGKCDYPLRDAMKELYTSLDGRDDKMFIGPVISIRLGVRPAALARSSRDLESCLWWLLRRSILSKLDAKT